MRPVRSFGIAVFLLLPLVIAACKRHEAARVEPGPATPGASVQGALMQGLRPFDVAVYTPSPLAPAAVAQAQEAVRARFAGLDLRAEPPVGPKPPTALVFAPPAGAFPPPDGDQLRMFARGLDAQQVSLVTAMKGTLVYSFVFDDDPGSSRLRDAQKLLYDEATAQGGYLWDQDTREMFSVQAWQGRRLDGWEGNLPYLRQQIALHQYQVVKNRYRSLTLGMAKFGLPDLVLEDAPLSQVAGVSWILNVVAQSLVEGATPDETGNLVVNSDTLRHEGAHHAFVDLAGAGASRNGRVLLRYVQPQGGDAANRLVNLSFPSYAGATSVERQTAAITEITGAAVDVARQDPAVDPELRAIMVKAQARLPTLAETFRTLQPGQNIEVKAPFDTDDGALEWLWVDVTGWTGTTITGTLKMPPRSIHALHLGSPVTVEQAKVADYLWMTGKGTFKREGGESNDVLLAREQQAGAAPVKLK